VRFERATYSVISESCRSASTESRQSVVKKTRRQHQCSISDISDVHDGVGDERAEARVLARHSVVLSKRPPSGYKRVSAGCQPLMARDNHGRFEEEKNARV